MVNNNYILSQRKNFSKDSIPIVEKAKRGEELTEDEVFILTSDEKWLEEHQEQLALRKELTEIKERVKCGMISDKDFQRLCDIVGFDDETKKLIQEGFSKRGTIKEEDIKKG